MKHANQSGKMGIMMELLKHIHEKREKVLIFSEYTTSLEMIRAFLLKDPTFNPCQKPGTHGRILYHTGSTRHDIMSNVEAFNNRPFEEVFAFLISTKAGGLGLNLMGASRVILFEPCWNPTSNIQAMSRAYRQGQRKEVVVYRLVGAHTIEEAIHIRSLNKTALACWVVDERATDLEDGDTFSISKFPLKVKREPPPDTSGDSALDSVFQRFSKKQLEWQRFKLCDEEASGLSEAKQRELMDEYEVLRKQIFPQQDKKKRDSRATALSRSLVSSSSKPKFNTTSGIPQPSTCIETKPATFLPTESVRTEIFDIDLNVV